MQIVLSANAENELAKVVDLRRYQHLKIKYLQAENIYNKFLFQLANKIFDNIKDIQQPTQEELDAALEKAKADFEHIQEAREAEKELIDIKKALYAEQGRPIKEFKSYFMQ